MKRTTALLCCLAILFPFLSGCVTSNPSSFGDEGYTALIEGKSSDVEFSASLTVCPLAEGETARSFTLSLDSPESLQGVSFSVKGKEAEISFKGEELYTVAIDGLPALRAISRSLSAEESPLSVTAISGSEAGIPGHKTLTKFEFSDYNLYVLPSDGSPVKLEALPDFAGEGFSLVFVFLSVNQLID